MTARARMAAQVATTLALVMLAPLVTSCGPGADHAPRAVRREVEPQWQDVFDGTPDIYAVIRPQAIKRDAIYGTFFKNLMRMAQARSVMHGVTTLEALEGCEEIIVGVRKGDTEDAALVFRGVPASLDVQKMTDASGNPIVRLVDGRAKVPEYEFVDPRAAGGSLFVLPDRTWVGTIGEARARARQAFGSPFGRPVPKADPQALAAVRLDAASFQTPRVLRSSIVGPLMRKLTSLTVALRPGQGGFVAILSYSDEDTSAWAEMHLKRVFDEIAHQPPRAGATSLDWLKTAQVGHDGRAVTVKLAVPPRLLEDLPNASAADIPL